MMATMSFFLDIIMQIIRFYIIKTLLIYLLLFALFSISGHDKSLHAAKFYHLPFEYLTCLFFRFGLKRVDCLLGSGLDLVQMIATLLVLWGMLFHRRTVYETCRNILMFTTNGLFWWMMMGLFGGRKDWLRERAGLIFKLSGLGPHWRSARNKFCHFNFSPLLLVALRILDNGFRVSSQ